MKISYVFIFLIATVFGYNSPKNKPVGVDFKTETIQRWHNWCQTWASDGNIYTMLNDGNGWWRDATKDKEHTGWRGSMCLQISGDENFTSDQVKRMQEWPKNHVTSSLYAYRTISVDGALYAWLWRSERDTWYRRPIENRLLYSPDLRQTFYRWNGDKAIWTSNMQERGVNLKYPEKRGDDEWMWASWFPSVVYNKGLDKYIMVSYGITDPGKKFWDGWCWDCKYPSSIGFWYSETPYGPWTQFHYEEYFYADRQENRTYGFKLSPKWISEDGKKMILIWSDAGDNHTTNYKWNQMEIEIITE